MNSWTPGASIQNLRKRAELLKCVRAFFEKRDVLEVETPAISEFPTLDLHLESIKVKTGLITQPTAYLITSPEYHMKRLLSAGSGSIFQVCKAFRADEAGFLHNPEFTLIEWYRVGWDHWRLMSEIEELLDILLQTGKAERISYPDIFKTVLDCDTKNLCLEQFHRICGNHENKPPVDLCREDIARDEWLNYLMGMFIEPKLGSERPVFIYDYPASQANLAKIYDDNPEASTRFELFYKGIELGNGFQELTDAEIQKKRFVNENRLRKETGKKELPIDYRLISALQSGMPDCAGIALGFDRVLMLALNEKKLDNVTAFSWNRH